MYLNTAWTMQVIRGVLLWLAAWAVSGPVAAYYEEAQLAQLLPVVALTALISGFNSTRMATLDKELMLGRLTILQLGTQAATIILTVVLAYFFRSVWSLVFGNVAGALLTLVLSHTFLPGHRNRFQFERAAFGQIFGFGKYIFIATLAGFLANQGDRAILGKYVSLTDLALYNIGYFLASVPIMLASTLTARIVFPLYANRPPSENDGNRRQIARARRLITGALFVGAAVLAVSGDWLTRLLYDSRYYGAGPILVMLAVSYLPTLIIRTYPDLMLAAGHSGRFALYLVTITTVRIGLLLYAASTYGVAGVVLVPLVAELLLYPVLILFIRPYRSWDPLHDAGFFLLSIAVGALAIWMNAEALAGFFTEAGLLAAS